MTPRSARTPVFPPPALVARAVTHVCLALVMLLIPVAAWTQTAAPASSAAASRAAAPKAAAPGAAQEQSSIEVRLKDALGATIPAATVTVRALPDGAVLTKDTDDTGITLFSGLRPGGYQVVVVKNGFIEIIRDVRLDPKDREELDLAMQVQFAESVTVVGTSDDVVNVLNGRATLPDIQGTVLFAGKKSDVLLLDQMDANVTSGNQRQVFAKIPGTQIWEHDSSGLQIGISSRGLDPNRSWETNQRMNGYDIMAEVFAYPDTYFSPPLDAVQRIEMVRGSASLQYGAQFGGLVNYEIKRAPLDRRFTFETTQTGGSNAWFSSHNQLGGTIGKVTYNGYYHHRQGDGYRRANNDFDNNTGFGQVEIAASERAEDRVRGHRPGHADSYGRRSDGRAIQ